MNEVDYINDYNRLIIINLHILITHNLTIMYVYDNFS